MISRTDVSLAVGTEIEEEEASVREVGEAVEVALNKIGFGIDAESWLGESMDAAKAPLSKASSRCPLRL